MSKIALPPIALLFAAGLAAAQTGEQDHQAHHPDGAASAAVPAPPKAAAPIAAKNADMAAKMKAMQEMHQKMLNASTPEERQALMAEHMRAMQAGMGMLKKQRPADPKARLEAMEQRMDMMQMMMEMMMDRMPAGPAAAGK